MSLAVAKDRQVKSVTLRTWRDGRGEELLPMTQAAEADGSTVYQAVFTAPDEPCLVWYYFVVHSGDKIFYYGNNPEERGGLGAVYETQPPSYQLTVHLPEARTPDWYKHAVVYQIFVDRFFNGAGKAVKNCKKGSLLHPFWDDDPVYVRERETGRILSYDFFGGNLAGVMAKLPYLRRLGVSAIYFNPIFESPSNHKYDTADYKTVDPMFGSNEDFAELCRQARELGMAVILDGVFSHTGSDSIYFNKEGRYPGPGAYQSSDSPYYSWYRFSKFPDEYESWWGVDALPNVNEMDPSYRNFIIGDQDSVVRHWIRLGAKGWRLDVADELPDEFIRELRQAMKEADSDSILIGEVWEDASRKVSYSQLRGYLHGDELDSPTNYPFRAVALDFLLGRQDAGDTGERLLSLCENYPLQHFYAALNMVGSHDVPRILTLLGGHEGQPDLPYSKQLKLRLDPAERETALARLKLLALWQMTFPGVPHIYYGDEAGLEGYTDPLNRRTFPWGREEAALVAWYEKVVGLRNSYPVLRTGRWQPLDCHSDVFGYVRWTEDEQEVFGQPAENNTAVVLLNRSAQEVTVRLDISRWCRGMVFDLLEHEREVAVGDGNFSVTLPPFAGKLFMTAVTGAGRNCGVLLHPTSLPSQDGCGDLGQEAYAFVDFLAEAGQSCWQILPLNPVGFGYSPYQSVSAFACEPTLLSIDALVGDGLLELAEVGDARRRHGISQLPANRVEFAAVRPYKEELFRIAARRFAAAGKGEDYKKFIEASKFWLPDYTLYMALTGYFGDDAWNNWPEAVALREEEALKYYRQLLADDIDYHSFLQYAFYRQWQTLRRYAAEKKVRIIADLPIFVAHHSADVWAHRELFKLEASGKPTVVAGVPPDYFSKTGQLWGNPLYNWRNMAKEDYCWWRERITSLLGLADFIRIDHFRGFEACWEVPAGEETAENGRWVKGSGGRFFAALERQLGRLPLIAEDLGVITPAVTALRQKFAYPGMKVLQFSFRQGDDGRAAPLDCGCDAVVYTGTHDNDTTAGWYRELAKTQATVWVDQYLDVDAQDEAGDLAWRMVELAYQCKAQMAVIPLQDLLGLGSEARMNTPGTVGGGNWQWRFGTELLTPDLAKRLAALAGKYRRGR